ncbi:class I SAM-dependent rRNA methyltransferase [Megasphaera vaginalis (ex Srinivasan et al. 2021)]|uniref:Ribosomal protein L11 methyltransferase-like protein n=1 Tax=Megasphaera vaginalis (ex Srinivasan et al. 2021) TaxID=1111454 RepID=U7USN8_9FIRM|nr:class I SAM-dependent rRNA methyltransferase [Megasphaera vaginalis (ex Srinivasan et al. 2021)]ERT61909.1 ribosomal protein L11 methyltransferase-like protein [Megasphaera vaginalis (ex Srinivasan et al. 2021)]
MRPYAKLYLTRKGERAARSGHPWVFGEEVTAVDGAYETGDLVDVCSDKGRYLGTGFANDISKIRVRLLSNNANDTFTEDFWRRRVRYAVAYRRTVMGETDFSCCRLIFGDADQLPGLTVDLYRDVLVAQTLCYGMDTVKDVIFRALVEELKQYGVAVRGIYERNDVSVRELDGLMMNKGWYEADFLPSPGSVITEIEENGITYAVDVENGQKTGFFLDQKYNRLAVAKLAAGRRVLDCFTHTGAFALNAASGGALSVTAVDISAEAVAQTNANIRRNHREDRVFAVQDNVFDLLTQLSEEKRHDFDFIILDPPAFTKSGHTLRNAVRGYKEINRKAMKLLPRGGYLATCSCSHFMTDELFRAMLRDAAADAGVCLRQIEGRQQSPDHPILWNVPETNYLKFYLFQVV